MPKIKYTKNELKSQRNALQRYQRYLPTLELKKAQLQIEVRKADGEISKKLAEDNEKRAYLATWIRLFGEEVDIGAYVHVQEVKQRIGNVAGVNVPVCESISFRREPVDYFTTPAWIDDGIAILEQLLTLRIELHILEKQRKLLAEELLVTSQRVNLFEKIKIPECMSNIRKIRIYLGDEQAAAVSRAKMVKKNAIEIRSAV